MKRQIRIVFYLVLASVLLSTYLWAEQWKISFNGYPGTMELSGGQSNYTGRFNLHGNWEQMLDLQVYRNAIFFRRAAADQKYLGVMEGGRMQGVFTQHGSGRYPWTAERTDIVSIDPVVPPLSGGDTGAVKNLALRKQARQSSTSYGGTPERAVDGNRDGNHNAGSVSHTANVPNDWWEVDLGSQKQIQEIKLWNRTDCCSERLSNFYVLVSPNPFSGNNLKALLNDPSIWHFHHQGAAARETTVAVAGEGRYVRVQLAGQNWLSLAEVEVFGHDSSGSTAYPVDTGSGTPVTIYWHMADDADVYLNGKALRSYSPSFKTRPDEAPRPAFSARATLHNGDIFTVGGRRGGSFGLMLLAVDDGGRIVFKTDRSSWAVYEPDERSDWYEPAVANSSAKRPVTVQPDPWYPQKELNARYHNTALSIWSEPDKRFAYLVGTVRLSDQATGTINPVGTWRHHPTATWVVSQGADGRYHAQEHGLGNASGPAYFTPAGSFRIDYVTRDGAVTGFYEVTFAPDGHTATGRVQELSGPRRSGNTSWTKVR
ncbi:galactose-binding domain-containing protein [Trichlorobacter lovleyi]|jgi:F5/8 type C domain.|uniref:Coagulation factor 5/8 type domain protein n=1 Tax=Trichlorobacter lovleyi (strain ATCC BAA-1151 / DSM 17278 / SZ) TaxID=398767 RepID=B3E2Q6_TRIL1|nr:discoidin domain-containing protein [Trichlorobacter lovleyi]ACD95713.1 coagulation factor 5/8 type domain protein [Trichlorobacter lovleyi SZ]